MFVAVDDVDAAMTRVRELGGEAHELGPDAAADMRERFGRFALCRDDQGSSFGLHQRP